LNCARNLPSFPKRRDPPDVINSADFPSGYHKPEGSTQNEKMGQFEPEINTYDLQVMSLSAKLEKCPKFKT
jgi:hypothetical protein